MTAEITTAVIDGPYRYRLSRSWGDGAQAVWVMHNPSTADANVDDPTIRRVRGFTKRLGCDGFVVVNLYAWRSTDPKALRSAWADPVGPDNDRHITEAVAGAPIVLAAWGTLQAWQRTRMLRLLQGPLHRTPLHHLGQRTRAGFPRHPLYLPADAPVVPWH